MMKKYLYIFTTLTLFLLNCINLSAKDSDRKLPVSIICWSNSFSSGYEGITVDKLYSCISEKCPEIRISKLYIERPSSSEGGNEFLIKFMNDLHKKNSSTCFSYLGDAYSDPENRKGIDLFAIQKAIDSGNIPKDSGNILKFLKLYAPQVLIDINNMRLVNQKSEIKFTSILFDVEADSSSVTQIKGLFYLLYFTKKYLLSVGLEKIKMETTLRWNQIQEVPSSAHIRSLFGYKLKKPEVIINLLCQYNIVSNIFAMLYRPSKQLLDNNSVLKSTWWKVYVEPALLNLRCKNKMTITPAIGLNKGDSNLLPDGSQLIDFFNNYFNDLNEINAKYNGKISEIVLGIHGLQGFYAILKNKEEIEE